MSQRQQKPRAARPNEAETFQLWVFSDAHVATDKAVSSAIRNGMEFTPPAAYPESLASALRQSESGGELGGPPFRWDIALDLGDNAGLWDLPDDEQGREVVAAIRSPQAASPRADLCAGRQPRCLPGQRALQRRQACELVVPQMGRSDRREHGLLGRRSHAAALRHRRQLGALLLQRRQHPLPDDERPQRPAVSGRPPRVRRRLAGRRGDQRHLGVVEAERRGGERRHRDLLPSPHAARDHGGVRRFRGRLEISGRHAIATAAITASTVFPRAPPISISSTTSRRRSASSAISSRIRARSISGSAATPTPFPTMSSAAAAMSSANGAPISSTARSCRNTIPS